ncbi:MAG: hypothetical protein OIF50_10645 [Flavobacteriaceae bacterium]|nr:hypothetical protein [Flavobacteriaceae bacterium]
MKWKKSFVLVVLFVLPLVTYLFFATGVNHFARLPVLTKKVPELQHFIPDAKVQFQNKISVLGFLGSEIDAHQSGVFNLYQKIDQHFGGFDDFQFIIVLPNGTASKVAKIQTELQRMADISSWHFVYASHDQISSLFGALETNLKLDDKAFTPYVFLMDKERALRGRDDDQDQVGGLLYGFDVHSAASLHNKMKDDVKILLAEYRLALKKNNKYKKKDNEK